MTWFGLLLLDVGSINAVIMGGMFILGGATILGVALAAMYDDEISDRRFEQRLMFAIKYNLGD